MSSAMKCDVCGKYYDKYRGIDIFPEVGKANLVTLYDEQNRVDSIERKSYDLCPECMKSLLNFLNNANTQQSDNSIKSERDDEERRL